MTNKSIFIYLLDSQNGLIQGITHLTHRKDEKQLPSSSIFIFMGQPTRLIRTEARAVGLALNYCEIPY